MARAKRTFIIGAAFVCAVSTLLLILAIATDSWVVSEASRPTLGPLSSINYGLFSGTLVLWLLLITPDTYTMHMTCSSEHSACAVSCRSTPAARLMEVEALAQGLTPTPSCTEDTLIPSPEMLDDPKVINRGLYITTIVMLVMALLFSVISTGLAILNVFKNPMDPKLGIFGIQIACGITGIFALCTLVLWGAVWAGGLSSHLAFAFIVADELRAESPRLGYSYWLILISIFSSIGAAALLYARQWLLEREPPPPSAAVKDEADGTIFLY